MFEKILLVTRRTRLAGLVERFNTKKQAKFYVEHAGQDFEEFEREDEAYVRAVDRLRDSLDVGLPVQHVDRGLVPTFLFSGKEIVVVAGQDGLVANVAKYVGEQPLVGVNPDPERFDGVLLPYEVAGARGAVRKVLEGKARLRGVTLAEARLEDGQRLLAFNDLFIGARTHVSARYRLSHGGQEESQSSSGVLVSTGAGSSGWLSSIFTLARSLTAQTGGVPGAPWRLGWEEPRLAFVVREPFVSRHSGAEVVGGFVTEEQELVLESRMPSGGVIFSDGMEEDFLVFGAGARAHIRPARQRARLVVG
ncbi:NAD+ kinase [Myxococcus sp. CA051A]|uniref:NAD+ kinase n=1 Tax=Myxococcus llanfairpwllgwyngyllgogerychwyrndrobwllllantysiliogogogochensis TaxID=2590453 RepID=A0A540WQ54_9BACT|nr:MULTISPECIES: NAD+ kinase [Myxococcus]NTX11644.1 NAD+ kinase [Myxococcus sp. CA056]NTX34259.1 NAD+ kinase [Myxococcus sp. CA033]NTX56185.1 NAD+ kinase [Myxococcus sp. CA039A]NTX60911.1 NAD+ kinase [Myxococcus sp. CA051A]TQF11139.1 NAD+ kinase [Myxococcus llanfairpwllgwyngyllgogerychwyrndrobwllllantysiliogogogochensis]